MVGISLLGCNAKPKRPSCNRAKVGQLVPPWVQRPDLVPGGELFSKANAEGLEATGAGHLVAQIQQEIHVLDGHHQSWEWFLGVVLGGRLKIRKGATFIVEPQYNKFQYNKFQLQNVPYKKIQCPQLY